MLKHHNFVSFFSTILLYLAIGTLFLYLQHTYIGTEEKPKEKIISFSLSEYIPEVIPPVEEIVEEKIVEPEVIEPEPVVEEEKVEPIVQEVIPEPIVEKVVPKPVVKKRVKKVVKPKKKVKKEKILKKKKAKKRVVKKRKKKTKVKVKKAVSVKKTNPAKKNRFLNQLRAKINRFKTYPRIAQKRGMQGLVKVRFTILSNGQVSHVSISGKKVFHSSARNAVKKSFPINVKNAPFSLPTTVNLTLRYQIR